MVQSESEADLKRLFDSMRREEAGAAPSFGHVWKKAGRQENLRPTRFRRSRLIPALAAGIAAVLVAWILFPLWTKNEDGELLALPVTTWRAPSDFLLHSSVDPLLRTIPEIGTDRQGLIEASRILKLSNERRYPS